MMFPTKLVSSLHGVLCQKIAYKDWFFHTYFNTLCLYKSLTICYYPTAAKSSKYMKRMIKTNIENNVSIDPFKNGNPLFIHLLYE